MRAACRNSGDALDSVLCLFAAKAAAAGQVPADDPTAAELEGWIAVHPQLPLFASGRGLSRRAPPPGVVSLAVMAPKPPGRIRGWLRWYRSVQFRKRG